MLIELVGEGLPEGLRARAMRRFAVRLGRYRERLGRVRVYLRREPDSLLGWACRVQAELVDGGTLELVEHDMDGVAASWRAAELLARRLDKLVPGTNWRERDVG